MFTMNKMIYEQLESKTHEELRVELTFFKDLHMKGNVYLEETPVDHLSIVELLLLAEPDNEDYINSMLNFGFKLNTTHQTRNIKKFNKHRKLLELSHHIASEYKKEYKCCAIRVKKTVHKGDILCGKTGMKNVYPKKYIENIKNFLKLNPLKNWDKNELDYSFKYIEKVDLYECIICENNIKKNERKRHLKSCKQNLEKILDF
jgi:hypothetical protein